jgi:hypothetical protein
MKQILINARLQIGLKGQNTELTGRGPLRRQRFVLDCRSGSKRKRRKKTRKRRREPYMHLKGH